MSNKTYDIIIWGASGFTGRLVAEYILKQYGAGEELSWAMAGRNQQKLEAIRKELGDENIPIVIADSGDMNSLEKMVDQTKVICTTVGPYAKYGSLLVEACVKHGVDYCDLTGEVQWIRRMVDKHHEQAKVKGVKIVHCCGFDSIPSDMGVFFIQKMAKAQTGSYCNHVKFRVKRFSGGFSGGTIASLMNVLVEAKDDPSIYGILTHPYSLNPEGERVGKDQKDLTSIAFDKDAKSWISPFVMAAINTKVVRRGHALAGYPYGKDFRYDEAVLAKSKFNARMALLTTGILASMRPGTIMGRIGNMILPKPGEGPSKEKREAGFFNIKLIGKLPNGSLIIGKVTGDRDPGYGSTSKMLGESAVCLARDGTSLPNISGVLTPSVAMGDALLERLKQNAGLSFEVNETKVISNV